MKNKDFFLSTENENPRETFQQYLQAIGQRLNTIRGNINNVQQYLKWLAKENIQAAEVSYTDLLSYVAYNKEQGNVSHTINQKILSIQHYYSYLKKTNPKIINPAEELRIRGTIIKQPHDILKWEELEVIYKTYEATNLTGKRNKVMLGMVIYQGLRRQELAIIEIKDIKLEEGKIYVPSTPNSNERILALNSVQVLPLQQYMMQVRPVLKEVTNKESEKLFISMGSGNKLDNGVTSMLQSIRKKHKEVKSLLQLRAGVISYWLKQYHIRKVQYMTGHKYISSTERYKTDILESLQEQIDKLHPLG